MYQDMLKADMLKIPLPTLFRTPTVKVTIALTMTTDVWDLILPETKNMN